MGEAAAARGRDDIFRADAVKIMIDGVAENFSAAMSLPYLEGRGHATSNRGHTFLEPKLLNEVSIAVDAAGFQLHFRTLGDTAVTVVLDAIEAVKRAHGPGAAARATLAHLRVVGERDIGRFAPLGAIANLQMLWAAVDEPLDCLTFAFLDPTLNARHYQFGDRVRAGASLACGSDWPGRRTRTDGAWTRGAWSRDFRPTLCCSTTTRSHSRPSGWGVSASARRGSAACTSRAALRRARDLGAPGVGKSACPIVLQLVEVPRGVLFFEHVPNGSDVHEEVVKLIHGEGAK
jgi:Amidohydrolase family